MKIKPDFSWLVVLVTLLSVSSVCAQVVADGAVATLSNTTNIIAGSVTIGTNGSFTLLTLSTNALLTNTLDGTIGFNPTARSNQVRLISPSARWQMGGLLFVGYNSAGNQLVVSNVALVQDNVGYLGANTGGSNQAVVTGVGSLWSNAGDVFVGVSAAGNRLMVGDGGTVRNNYGFVGVNVTSSDNQALVTGNGSTWTNALDLHVGYFASRNQLIVSNGASLLVNGSGFVGFKTNANANTIAATGPGTRFLLNSNLYVGTNGAFNLLVVSNGARVANKLGSLGHDSTSTSNAAIVTGFGSIWSNALDLFIGYSGKGNRLTVSNGGWVRSDNMEIGHNVSSSTNEVLVTGPGSFCQVQQVLYLGYNSSGNRLVVSNGAYLHDDNIHIGFFGSNNEMVVTGPGTIWTNRSGIQLGRFRGHNRLIITNQAFVFAREVYIGLDPLAPNNRLVMSGGTLLVTNSTGVGALDVQRGTNVLNAGLIDVAKLLLMDTLSWFEFNGGTLITSGTTNTNGRVFTVGNGTSAANFRLRGGTHTFANGLAIANNGSLTGNGTVLGTVNVLPGGTLAPGTSVGKLTLNNSPVLQGVMLMELSRNGSVLTNDEVQVGAGLTYGGSLVVTNIGVTPLAAGDRFKLFTAAAYLGSFSSVSLPVLGANLSWTNKLAVDGSIEVVGGPAPQFTGISKSGTNIILTGTGGIANTSYVVLTATNVAQPLSEWTSIATNQFGAGGNFTFTNGINPGTPQRFFLLRWP